MTLITGGARSGKSLFAEKLASEANGSVVYIATMSVMPGDEESTERVSMHRNRRPQNWRTIEEPRHIGEAIKSVGYSMDICLIDCLSLWLSNLLPHIDESAPAVDLAEIEKNVSVELHKFFEAVRSTPGTQFIVVTNEVGSGIVPENIVARAYRDLLGTLNQKVAHQSARVWLCCVGLQLKLK